MGFLGDELFVGVAGETLGEKYEISYPYGGRFENVKSIECVGSDVIVFKLGKCLLCVKGEDMRIYSYCGSDVTVKGKIFCVERSK